MGNEYVANYTSAAPLSVFRIAFGTMLFWGIVRFWTNGWIEDLYIQPLFYFPYYGFEFVKPLGTYTYTLFVVCGLSALLVAVGLWYRAASIALFFSFTYIELIDKTTYLNHYYFVSMVCLLLIFLPANAYFSVDSYRHKDILSDQIPAWCLDVLKVFVGILYFYAGLAKLNSDWLLHAQPLRIWLPARNDLPLIGPLFSYSWIHYAFSWLGCFYDLSIPFLLWNAKTRIWAYVAVVVFHLLTSALFPIGMFPYIMIVTALIFFSPSFHERLLHRLGLLFSFRPEFVFPSKNYLFRPAIQKVVLGFLSIFLVFHLFFPFRYLLYPGELFWTEEGYRFSWRVMLMEKAGHILFVVKDSTGKRILVDNGLFLTDLQKKMMSTQPDMILQYAHLLRDYYAQHGFVSPQVYADAYVALNGRLGKPLIDPTVDLAKEQESFAHKNWILPFEDEIKGL